MVPGPAVEIEDNSIKRGKSSRKSIFTLKVGVHIGSTIIEYLKLDLLSTSHTDRTVFKLVLALFNLGNQKAEHSTGNRLTRSVGKKNIQIDASENLSILLENYLENKFPPLYPPYLDENLRPNEKVLLSGEKTENSSEMHRTSCNRLISHVESFFNQVHLLEPLKCAGEIINSHVSDRTQEVRVVHFTRAKASLNAVNFLKPLKYRGQIVHSSERDHTSEVYMGVKKIVKEFKSKTTNDSTEHFYHSSNFKKIILYIKILNIIKNNQLSHLNVLEKADEDTVIQDISSMHRKTELIGIISFLMLETLKNVYCIKDFYSTHKKETKTDTDINEEIELFADCMQETTFSQLEKLSQVQHADSISDTMKYIGESFHQIISSFLKSFQEISAPKEIRILCEEYSSSSLNGDYRDVCAFVESLDAAISSIYPGYIGNRSIKFYSKILKISDYIEQEHIEEIVQNKDKIIQEKESTIVLYQALCQEVNLDIDEVNESLEKLTGKCLEVINRQILNKDQNLIDNLELTNGSLLGMEIGNLTSKLELINRQILNKDQNLINNLELIHSSLLGIGIDNLPAIENMTEEERENLRQNFISKGFIHKEKDAKELVEKMKNNHELQKNQQYQNITDKACRKRRSTVKKAKAERQETIEISRKPIEEATPKAPLKSILKKREEDLQSFPNESYEHSPETKLIDGSTSHIKEELSRKVKKVTFYTPEKDQTEETSSTLLTYANRENLSKNRLSNQKPECHTVF